ncbi:MAG TPA: acylphosphatase [Fimbriimonas sp.]
MAALRIVVSGHVQGVGFRYYAARTARMLDVEGAVWNRADRKVEAVAEHRDPFVVEDFAKRMWDGPGRVEDVQTEPAPGGYSGFEIRRT